MKMASNITDLMGNTPLVAEIILTPGKAAA
jgi:hypothetical protein